MTPDSLLALAYSEDPDAGAYRVGLICGVRKEIPSNDSPSGNELALIAGEAPFWQGVLEVCATISMSKVQFPAAPYFSISLPAPMLNMLLDFLSEADHTPRETNEPEPLARAIPELREQAVSGRLLAKNVVAQAIVWLVWHQAEERPEIVQTVISWKSRRSRRTAIVQTIDDNSLDGNAPVC